MMKWKRQFDIISNSLDEKPYEHGMFRYHLSTYLAYRVVNGTGNTYFPAKVKHTKMFEHTRSFKKNAQLLLMNMLGIQNDKLAKCKLFYHHKFLSSTLSAP